MYRASQDNDDDDRTLPAVSSICKNLAHSLAKLRSSKVKVDKGWQSVFVCLSFLKLPLNFLSVLSLSSDKSTVTCSVFQVTEDHELYLRLVDCVILGPASITQTEAEAGLGIESWQYSKSVLRRSDTSSQSEERAGWRHQKMKQSSPEPRRSVRLVEPDERSHDKSHERPRDRSYDRSHERPHERPQRALRSPDPGHGLRLSPEPKFCKDQGTNDKICANVITSYLL